MYVHEYVESEYNDFRRMFLRYFAEDLNLHYNSDVMEEVVNEVLADRKYRCWLWIARERGEAAGFALAQIDTPDNPWCLRNGCGFVREFAVEPKFRGQGAAHALLNVVEARFCAERAPAAYLTTENIAFWTHMGYAPDGTICPRNHLPVCEKSLAYVPPAFL